MSPAKKKEKKSGLDDVIDNLTSVAKKKVVVTPMDEMKTKTTVKNYTKVNCRVCMFCPDMPKFGGPGELKQVLGFLFLNLYCFNCSWLGSFNIKGNVSNHRGMARKRIMAPSSNLLLSPPAQKNPKKTVSFLPSTVSSSSDLLKAQSSPPTAVRVTTRSPATDLPVQWLPPCKTRRTGSS